MLTDTTDLRSVSLQKTRLIPTILLTSTSHYGGCENKLSAANSYMILICNLFLAYGNSVDVAWTIFNRSSFVPIHVAEIRDKTHKVPIGNNKGARVLRRVLKKFELKTSLVSLLRSLRFCFFLVLVSTRNHRSVAHF